MKRETTTETKTSKARGTKAKETTVEETKLAVAMPGLFGDINFNELNGVIESLGDSSKDLTNEEKKAAITIIEEWNKTVLDRLDIKSNEANSFINTLDPANQYVYMDIDEFEELVAITGTIRLYNDYKKKQDELRAHKAFEPIAEVIGLNDTIEQKLVKEQTYQLERAKYDIEQRKLERKVFDALKVLKREMAANQTIQELINRLRKYNRNVNNFKLQCKDKSQYAKLNVSISSAETRKALKALLDFKF